MQTNKEIIAEVRSDEYGTPMRELSLCDRLEAADKALAEIREVIDRDLSNHFFILIEQILEAYYAKNT
jgi:ribosomal protein L31E